MKKSTAMMIYMLMWVSILGFFAYCVGLNFNFKTEEEILNGNH